MDDNYLTNIDKQSNSRYYHGDCKCDKVESITHIRIQCENCINKIKNAECKCCEYSRKYTYCVVCAKYRDEIDLLYEELDTTIMYMKEDIKSFVDCEEYLNEIELISRKLRILNSKLLENM